MVLIRTQGTALNHRLIQVWLGSGQTLGHCFAYDAVRPEHHGATLHYPFIWDEVDGTGEPRLLAGSSKESIYQRGRSRIGFIVFYRLVDALLTYESWLKVVAHQYHPLRPS